MAPMSHVILLASAALVVATPVHILANPRTPNDTQAIMATGHNTYPEVWLAPFPIVPVEDILTATPVLGVAVASHEQLDVPHAKKGLRRRAQEAINIVPSAVVVPNGAVPMSWYEGLHELTIQALRELSQGPGFEPDGGAGDRELEGGTCRVRTGLDLRPYGNHDQGVDVVFELFGPCCDGVEVTDGGWIVCDLERGAACDPDACFLGKMAEEVRLLGWECGTGSEEEQRAGDCGWARRQRQGVMESRTGNAMRSMTSAAGDGVVPCAVFRAVVVGRLLLLEIIARTWFRVAMLNNMVEYCFWW